MPYLRTMRKASSVLSTQSWVPITLPTSSASYIVSFLWLHPITNTPAQPYIWFRLSNPSRLFDRNERLFSSRMSRHPRRP